jgi:hypothetical protein
MLDVFVTGAILLMATLAMAAPERVAPPKALDPVEAAKQGRELVEDILAQRPEKNFTNTGVLRMRDSQDHRIEVPVESEIVVTTTNWISIYATRNTDRSRFASLTVTHSDNRPNRYIVPNVNPPSTDSNQFYELTSTQLYTPFAGSDFWLCDLGLEFFHWPEQKILKTELRKTRACKVFESKNPNPAPGAYSRVVSWIDEESDGIIHAEAYDSQNKLLKEFDTKKIKKVKGEWQLEEMEIRNVQTGSRSQIEFDLDSK